MELSPILLSIETSLLSIVITFFLGIYAARLVYFLSWKRLRFLLDTLFTLPLVLPPTVVGFLLLYLLGIKRPLGMFLYNLFGIKLVFSFSATVITATVVAFPLMYRSAKAAFESLDLTFLHAARTLGLSERQIFYTILLPLSLPGLRSGTILAFARSMGEFGATTMLAGNILYKTRTLPLAVYSSVAAGNMREAFFYVSILLVISFAIILLMNYWSYREKSND